MEVSKHDMVLIAVPVYNGEKTLAKTLRSLVDQDYKNFKIFICDNSSTDGTDKIIAEYEQEFPELISHIVNPVVLNGEANWLYMLSNLPIGADYVSLFHADDIYEPTIVSEQVAVLRATGAGAAFTVANLIDEHDRNINRQMKFTSFLPEDLEIKEVYGFEELYISILKHHNYVKTPSAMFPRETLIKHVPLFKKKFKSSADLDLWLRIAKTEGISIINKPLLRYRISATQGSQILSKKRTHLSDFFTVMDSHLTENLKQHENIKWYEAMRAMDYIICSYNLIRQGNSNEAMQMLKKALNISHAPNILKSKRGYKQYIFGWAMYLVIKFKLERFFNRHVVLDL